RQGLSARGRAYGPVRLWGSVAFIAANLGAGLLLDLLPRENLIWTIAAALAGMAAASLLLRPLERAVPARAAPTAALHRLLFAPAFLTVALAASLIQASHAVYYGFSTLAWAAEGFDGVTIGALWGLGVAAEIVLFALSGRLPG